MNLNNFIKLSLYVVVTLVVFVNLIKFIIGGGIFMLMFGFLGAVVGVMWVFFGSYRAYKIGSEMYEDMKYGG